MKNIDWTRICLLAAVLGMAGINQAQAVNTWYVDYANGLPGNSGTGGWNNARPDLQDVITDAGDGDIIHVARGVYGPINSGNKTLAIIAVVPGETVIKGTWNGSTSSPSGTRAATLGSAAPGGSTFQTNTVLHGFTIRNGCANSGSPSDIGSWGGGVLGGTLVNCVVTNNFATCGGGAAGSAIYDSEITGNTATYGGGLSDCRVSGSNIHGNYASKNGGGAHNSYLLVCDVHGNSAQHQGGGCAYYVESGWPTPANNVSVHSCRVFNNTTVSQSDRKTDCGGGIARGTVYNSLIYGNSAGWGGGVFSAALYNCTVAGNTAAHSGGGISHDSDYYTHIVNSIIWGNQQASSGAEMFGFDAGSYCSHTLINDKYYESYVPVGAKVTATYNDPGFVDAANQNYHLATNSPLIGLGTFDDWDTSGNYQTPLPVGVAEYGDLDGDLRTTFANGGEQINLGAYENGIAGLIRLDGNYPDTEEDDILLRPGLGEQNFAPDANGHYTIGPSTGVLDNNGNAITNAAGAPVPQGSIIVNDRLIICNNGNPPTDTPPGFIQIPNGASLITWNDIPHNWVEIFLPNGGYYTPELGGVVPGGAATTHDGDVILRGHDYVLPSPDDIHITPGGDLNYDSRGNLVVGADDAVKDSGGLPIKRKNGASVPEGSLITPGGAILVNDHGLSPNPDGTFTFQPGDTVITWDTNRNAWVETAVPGDGTFTPGASTFETSLLIESITVADDFSVNLTWTPPAEAGYYILLAKERLADTWLPVTKTKLPTLGNPLTSSILVPPNTIRGGTASRFFTLKEVIQF